MQKQVDICVIGSGHAGFQVVKMLRANKFEGSIAIICQDDGDYYSKPALSTAFTKQLSAKQLIVQDSATIERNFNCEILRKTIVEQLSPKDKHILCRAIDASSENQIQIAFDKLIIATGAKPRRLPTIEAGSNHVFAINHLQDYLAFSKRVSTGDHVAIVGGGLVGSEYANDLVQAGFRVSLISRSSVVMPNLLPHNVAYALTHHLKELGVETYLDTSVRGTNRTERGICISLSSGETIEADAVISAVGLLPNDQLAADAGLSCDHGIVVNQFMQSSHADIYALGDVARTQSLNLQYIMPINIGAKVIAKHIMNNPEPLAYPAMPITIKTTRLPTVVSPPYSAVKGDIRWEIEGKGYDQMAVAYDDEQVVGFAVSGAYMKQRFPLTKKLPLWLS